MYAMDFRNFTNSCCNVTNATTTDTIAAWRANLHMGYKIILSAILLLIMCGMGCTMSLSAIRDHIKRPEGYAIGALGQFILLPLLAFSLAHALSLAQENAIGLLIISTCPGGAVSSVFTYWFDGDVSLSVSMTTVATVLSFGTMPLNLWIYTRSWTSDTARIPYVNIAITLASILGPVIVGMVIKWRSEKRANVITKIGSWSGIGCICIAIIMQAVLSTHMFTSGWKVFLATSLLPLVGSLSSYLVAFLFRRTPAICRTIAIETGCQNVPMAMAIIELSFNPDVSGPMSLPTIIYGTVIIVEALVICGIYKLAVRLKSKNNDVAAHSADGHVTNSNGYTANTEYTVEAR